VSLFDGRTSALARRGSPPRTPIKQKTQGPWRSKGRPFHHPGRVSNPTRPSDLVTGVPLRHRPDHLAHLVIVGISDQLLCVLVSDHEEADFLTLGPVCNPEVPATRRLIEHPARLISAVIRTADNRRCRLRAEGKSIAENEHVLLPLPLVVDLTASRLWPPAPHQRDPPEPAATMTW
jgi:hypothetical protein